MLIKEKAKVKNMLMTKFNENELGNKSTASSYFHLNILF